MGDEKQMKAGVTDGTSPGEHSTWAEGPGWLGRFLCFQHQLQFGQIHRKCSCVGGTCQEQDVEFRLWSLLYKNSDTHDCRFYISQCG